MTRVDFDAEVNGTGQRVCQMTSFSVVGFELLDCTDIVFFWIRGVIC